MTEPIPPDTPRDVQSPLAPELLTLPQLIENRYLGLLATYNVSWDNEKTARDVWQNFFDGQGGTMDGVTHSLNRTSAGTQVSISGSGEYDYSHLLHMGGGTKTLEGSSVGGYKEGAKVAALIMLTRMGAEQVVHESGDWRLTYYLGDVPDYMIGSQPTKGLYARVEKVPFQLGSRFTVKFPNPKIVREFIEARNLFYSSENPDFQNPTFNNPDVGGFKLHKNKRGNIYEAGQRRPYMEDRLFSRSGGSNAGEYNAVPDITLWTRGKVFDADRDRGAVTKGQIEKRAIKAIVKGMTKDDMRRTITSNPEFWYGRSKPVVPEGPQSVNPDDIDDIKKPDPITIEDVMFFVEESLTAFYPGTIPGQLLEVMVGVYVKKYHGQTLDFPPQYIATGGAIDYIGALEGAGYIICHPAMKDLGMITTDEAVTKLLEHFRVEPSEAESTRIELLREFVRDLIGLDEIPQIWMFNAAKEKSIFHGHYTPEFLWESQEQIHQEFSTALRTYLHEIAHGKAMNKGHDTEFARAFGLLFNVAMLKLENAITDPTSEDSQKVKHILQRWEETKSSLGNLPPRVPVGH